MKKKISLTILVVTLLAGCSAPVSTPTTVSTAISSATPLPLENTPVPTVVPPAQAPPTVVAVDSSGVIVYKIVPAESQVTYEVGETFINQSNRFNLAIGVTKQISGEITANKTEPAKSSIGPITVDVSQFTSDSNRRDSAIRGRWLESEKFPQAVFTPTKIDTLPSSYKEGQDYSFKVSGDLKVREVTKPVIFDVTARLTGDTLSGSAVTTIQMSDFGVGPISIGGMLNTEDKAKLTLQFVARP
jgi:polyisoprenoid-binding protein YceI